MILAARFTFIVERSWKNMYFHPKLAWPPATYDVISRNHSNWPSLNLSQNLREGWTNSYWKRQVLMFYPLGKNSEKPYGGVASTPSHPPCTSEGKKKIIFSKLKTQRGTAYRERLDKLVEWYCNLPNTSAFMTFLDVLVPRKCSTLFIWHNSI